MISPTRVWCKNFVIFKYSIWVESSKIIDSHVIVCGVQYVTVLRACIVIIRTLHADAGLSLWLDSPMFWAPWHQNISTYSQPSFSSSTWKRGFLWMCKLGVISQERLKIEVTVSDCWELIGSHICHVDWHNNGWPWVTLNGRFTDR